VEIRSAGSRRFRMSMFCLPQMAHGCVWSRQNGKREGSTARRNVVRGSPGCNAHNHRYVNSTPHDSKSLYI
jgi:hypothetical protein